MPPDTNVTDNKKTKGKEDRERESWNENAGKGVNRELVGNFVRWESDGGSESWRRWRKKQWRPCEAFLCYCNSNTTLTKILLFLFLLTWSLFHRSLVSSPSFVFFFFFWDQRLVSIRSHMFLPLHHSARITPAVLRGILLALDHSLK